MGIKMDLLNKILEKLNEISNLQATHTAQLEEHMRRTEALEKHLEQVRSEIKPLRDRMNQIIGVLVFGSALATILKLFL